ncbi:hypothetical protein TWF730_009053 [Orbilia blumenaviensis]|uniref:F-box domain-containing protein n=1 Tax=Orbilia blumenaviensis TaxID=1796055 RepID=A0AAV9UYM6_9PEZI
MDPATPRILQMLPVDILSYLIEQIIDDTGSLKALSQTNRAFQLLALPKLSSHTVILDLSTGLRGEHLLDPVFRLISDFNNNRNFRIPGLVRVLELRDQWPEKAARACSFERASEEFVDALYTFLGKCTGLRKFLRDGYEHHMLKTTDLVGKVLELPRLRVLCLKIHQDKEWVFNETPRFEEYECYETLSKETGERGLKCLSVAMPMSLDRPWWGEAWELCRKILIDNKHTLKHLYFDGPDLEQIVNGMDANSLAEMRLSTLRFRLSFDPSKFCAVLGLTQRVDKSSKHTLETNDAVTGLRRLELHDTARRTYNYNISSSEMLPYMNTPNLKRAQLFSPAGDMRANSARQARRAENMISTHLSACRKLEFVELGPWENQAKLEDKLEFLSQSHADSVRTLTMTRVALDLCYKPYSRPGPIAGFSGLRRLEILQDRISFFWSVESLWKVIKTRNTISEVRIIMRQPAGRTHHRLFSPSIGSYISLPRRILTPIYSTAFYLHNRRKGIDTGNCTAQSGELFPSTRVMTSYRQMLGDADSDLLLINTYLSHMLHVKRLGQEQELFPQPQDVFGSKAQNEVTAFSAFISGLPKCLRLFELEYKLPVGGVRGSSETVRRNGDVWRMVRGEWLHEEVSTDLLPW